MLSAATLPPRCGQEQKRRWLIQFPTQLYLEVFVVVGSYGYTFCTDIAEESAIAMLELFVGGKGTGDRDGMF